MKNTSKVLTLLLLVCMLATTFLTACGGGAGGAGTTTTTTTSSTQGGNDDGGAGDGGDDGGDDFVADIGTTASYDTPYPLDENLKYGDEKVPAAFKILSWNSEIWQLQTVTDGDVINTALYDHILYVNEKLGIKLGFYDYFSDSWEARDATVTMIDGYIKLGDVPDLICTYAPTCTKLALKELCADLQTVQTLNNFRSPWWSGSLVQNAKLKGKNYYMTGEASTSLLYRIQCITMNLDLIETHGLMDDTGYDDPYQMVLDKAWTWDNFKNMTKDLYQDTDGDNVASAGDTYGFFVPTDIEYDFFPISIGMRAMTENINEAIAYDIFSQEYRLEKMTNWVADMQSYIYDSVGVNAPINGLPDTSIRNVGANSWFLQGNVAFACGNMGFIKDHVVPKCNFTYGVVPYPMYDSSQKNYCTTLPMWYSMFVIPAAAKNSEMSGAVLEVLGYDGYVKVSKVVFEECFKSRYDLTGNDFRVYDILRNNLFFDPARLLSINGAFGTFRAVMRDKLVWTTKLDTDEVTARQNLDALLAVS